MQAKGFPLSAFVVIRKARLPNFRLSLALTVVALGGAFGSALRYLVGQWFLERFGPGFPWGTFTINVSGAFLIGIVLQLAASRIGLHPYLRLFLATGILGGFTTFSTFAYETYALSSTVLSWQSLTYSLGSVFCGVVASYAGVMLIRGLTA